MDMGMEMKTVLAGIALTWLIDCSHALLAYFIATITTLIGNVMVGATRLSTTQCSLDTYSNDSYQRFLSMIPINDSS